MTDSGDKRHNETGRDYRIEVLAPKLATLGFELRVHMSGKQARFLRGATGTTEKKVIMRTEKMKDAYSYRLRIQDSQAVKIPKEKKSFLGC